MRVISWVVLLALTFSVWAIPAQQAPHSRSMTNARLGELLQRIDPDVKGSPGGWTISFQGRSAQIVTDPNADRMRIMIPLVEADKLTQDQLYRLLQANFESALDARYAVAQGVVWSVFIHPLSALDDAEFVAGVAQTFNAAVTYGTTFSSGLFNFGGGDNGELFDAIKEKGTRS
jgi:hypothetical protein